MQIVWNITQNFYSEVIDRFSYFFKNYTACVYQCLRVCVCVCVDRRRGGSDVTAPSTPVAIATRL